jgi:hypothetical protein
MPELDTLFDATLARDGATFGVADDGVDNTKLADMAAGTIKGLPVGSPATGDPMDLDADEVSDILDTAADPFVRTSVAGVALTDGDKGDVTVSASGATWTIDNAAVTLAKQANLAESTVIGRAAGAGTGVPTALTATQATAILDNAVGDSGSGGTKGLVPAPASGDAAAGKFLKADATWAVPAGGSGGAGVFSQFTPYANEPPASIPATPDLRNSRPVLDFDGSTDEEAVFSDVLSPDYGSGGLTVDTYWAFTSATTGSLRVQAAIERTDASGLDIDADSFAAFQSAGGSAPGTSGQVIKVTVTFTDGAQMDSVAAGELYRLKIRRDADGTSGTDDIATDAELVFVTVRES